MTFGTLLSVSSLDRAMAHPVEDVRDLVVSDRVGHEVGVVEDLLVDEQEGRVRFVRVQIPALLGLRSTFRLIPVDLVAASTHYEIVVCRTAAEIAAAPRCDRSPMVAEDIYLSVYEHFGVDLDRTIGPTVWPLA